MTESNVHIHFQRKKNGGGEIERVTLLKGGKAIVVFEDPKGTLVFLVFDKFLRKEDLRYLNQVTRRLWLFNQIFVIYATMMN